MLIPGIGLLALASVFLSTSRIGGDDAARFFMQTQLRSLVEQIKVAAPATVMSTYDGFSSNLPVGSGTSIENATLSVQVAEPQPNRLLVTVTGDWANAGINHQLTLMTGVYAP